MSDIQNEPAFNSSRAWRIGKPSKRTSYAIFGLLIFGSIAGSVLSGPLARDISSYNASYTASIEAQDQFDRCVNGKHDKEYTDDVLKEGCLEVARKEYPQFTQPEVTKMLEQRSQDKFNNCMVKNADDASNKEFCHEKERRIYYLNALKSTTPDVDDDTPYIRVVKTCAVQANGMQSAYNKCMDRSKIATGSDSPYPRYINACAAKANGSQDAFDICVK